MATVRQKKARQASVIVTEYLQEHPGEFHRITEVAEATGLPIPTVNNALRRMYLHGQVVCEMRRKKVNGKRYPVYLYYHRTLAAGLPAWLMPPPPKFTPEQIKGARTVLGFTGNLGLKEALKQA